MAQLELKIIYVMKCFQCPTLFIKKRFFWKNFGEVKVKNIRIIEVIRINPICWEKYKIVAKPKINFGKNQFFWEKSNFLGKIKLFGKNQTFS